MTQLNVKNLDHLGIIAAVVDELGLVDYINEQLQENDRAKISAGLVVKAMILNGWLSPCLCVMLCYELKQANNLSRRWVVF